MTKIDETMQYRLSIACRHETLRVKTELTGGTEAGRLGYDIVRIALCDSCIDVLLAKLNAAKSSMAAALIADPGIETFKMVP